MLDALRVLFSSIARAGIDSIKLKVILRLFENHRRICRDSSVR